MSLEDFYRQMYNDGARSSDTDEEVPYRHSSNSNSSEEDDSEEDD